MSNRTDWPELVDELLVMFGLDLLAVESARDWLPGVRKRFETELHNAFVAGQEQFAKAPECEDMDIDEELMHLRAFKREWANEDGNSPGYNCQKARNYGRQAANYKKLYLAFKNACIAIGKMRPAHVNIYTGDYVEAMMAQSKAIDLEREIRKEGDMTLDAIDEANQRAQEEMKQGPTPFHDKHWAKTPIGSLTIEQLEAEVARRKSEPQPYMEMNVYVKVTGRRPNTGEKVTILEWNRQDVEPDSFSCSHNDHFLSLKVATKK